MPVVLDVVEERDDQLGVEVADVELVGLLAGALGGEREQQPDGVAVCRDVWGLALRWRCM